METVKEVDEYLESLNTQQKTVLSKLRNRVKKILPKAEEYVSSGVPAFRYKGRYLISYGATQKHLSLYVMQGNGIKILKNDLSKYDFSNTVIRFTPENPITNDVLNK